MRIEQGILISFIMILLLMVVGTAAAQAPAEEWNTTFGAAYNDGALSVQQLSDGGYIIAGYYSQDSTYGSTDAWLIKNYANGTEEWNMTFGGSLYDCAESARQTADGGYILAAITRSFGAVETDALLIKTDASGTEEWNMTFGGVAYDGFKSVQQTFNTNGDPDGYIVAGYADNDAMLIKIYADGTEEWNKRFDSGSLYERAESVQQTADGGYILAGHTGSTVSTNSDFWLIKTSADGTEEWNKRFDSGVSDNDYAYSVQQTSDGGYILAGSTGSYNSDFWLIKTSADGTEEWNKKFDSGSASEQAESVQQTADGGYIIAGRTYSIANSDDAWLIKTSADGTEEWSMTFGGTGNDAALSVQQTSDGGYIIAGFTAANGNDAWLIKIAEAGQAVTTHYVGVAGGYVTIQAAVDAAADGDTIIVYPGTYTENVLVNKELIIGSYSGNPEDTVVQADDSLVHVFNVTANNVTISGFSVTGTISDDSGHPLAGVYLDDVKGCTIENNFFTNDASGIWVDNSTDNTLTSNIALDNSVYGIILSNSSNNMLNNNKASNSQGGIAGIYSSNNTLSNSTVENTMFGIIMFYSSNNMLSNNTVAGSTMYGIIMMDSINDKLTSNIVTNSYNGIYIDSSSNDLLISNTANHNDGSGIFISNSINNTLTSNMVSGNNYCGIWLDGNNSMLSNNSVSDGFYGFYLTEGSINNLIYSNCFSNNTHNTALENYVTGSSTFNSTEMLTYMYNGNIFTSYIGNNYSDYEGVDSNGDGIGDTPHYEDSYPLMFWPVEPIEKPPVTESEPVANAGGPYSAVEGSEMIFDASRSYDPDGVYLEYRWDFESNGTWTAWSTEPAATYTWNDDWTGMVTVEVSDGEFNNTSTAAVTVTNANPVLGAIVMPTDSFRVGTLVSVSGTFSDPGILDTHTAVWNWGDGTSDAGTVIETEGSGTVTGGHRYTTAGNYWVTLNVTDDDGGSANVTSQQYVVVYPATGYLTGAGSIQSPAGAYALVPSFTGKGTLKISSKYPKGAALPSMTTEFSIKSKTVNMNFRSTSYDSIVIDGAHAKYTGSGTINKAGDYGYMVSAVDGDIAGDGIDRFRIKIWDKASGNIVYDNEMGVSEDTQPAAVLTGSIVIYIVN